MLEWLSTVITSAFVYHSTPLTLMITRVVNLQTTYLIRCKYISTIVLQFLQECDFISTKRYSSDRSLKVSTLADVISL